MPGAGTDGRDAGQHVQRRRRRALSGLIEGALALVAFLILGSLIAWVPIAALAGILIVIGVRMFDRAQPAAAASRARPSSISW